MIRCLHISIVMASQPYMVMRTSRSTLESRSPPSVSFIRSISRLI